MTPQEIINFWFSETDPSFWFKKDDNFDELIKRKFSTHLNSASNGELFSWRNIPEGRLAEIIILDQFSRNLFRNDAKSFAQDSMALVLAQEAIRSNIDQQLSIEYRHFLYMPYMHSESKIIHQEAVILFKNLNSPETLEYELKHKAIIDRFGRYPHRNVILNRLSTPEELSFLKEPNSSF